MRLHIQGMDCASCVGKIEAALARMPGVSDIRLNFATETLELTLAPQAGTRIEEIEKTIQSLGFGVSAPVSHDACEHTGANLPHTAPGSRWWQTRKGRQVTGVGALMGIAYVLAWLLPAYGEWVFVLAVMIGVAPFARKAISLARSGTPFSIETLMSAAALGALFIGEAEEAAAVVFLFSVGELLEGVAAGHARAGIKSLVSLVPKSAILLDRGGGQREVSAASLRMNDHVLVRPGDRVPADGVIIHGASSLDESPITGESMPRAKGLDDHVYAGSINIEGALELRVEKTAGDNTIARIIHLVEQAQASKAPTARFIERFSHYYTPAVMLIALLIMIIPPLALGGGWHDWLYRGLALLLIACPCALVLSTPAAIASGLAVGTRRGLLVKGGNALETIGRVRTIAFDKTGTLTEGRPHVTDVVSFTQQDASGVLALAAGVESGSGHPLARAIASHAESLDIAIPTASHAFATAGKAAHATIAGQALAVGSPAYANQSASLSPVQQARIQALQHDGKTVSVLIDESRRTALGLLALRDEPRQDALAGILALQALNVRPIMLTGDNHRTAQAIAGQLGMDCESELLPQDKLRLIDDLKLEAKVAMVGDGINDAPALATADVGIAMGGGTDVAMETADAALLANRVTDLAHLVALSRATMANIQQNVAIALGLKGAFLITTVLGITGLWMAVLADAGATAIVTFNALRLLRFKGPKPVGHPPHHGEACCASHAH